jgi:hypothetical protein
LMNSCYALCQAINTQLTNRLNFNWQPRLGNRRTLKAPRRSHLTDLSESTKRVNRPLSITVKWTLPMYARVHTVSGTLQ